jgi:hypothetical protein
MLNGLPLSLGRPFDFAYKCKTASAEGGGRLYSELLKCLLQVAA